MKIYAIYDSKAEAYLQPFFAPNKAVAIRTFANAAQNPETNFGKFPEDYTLFEIGEWNETNSKLTDQANIALGAAIEYTGAQE